MSSSVFRANSGEPAAMQLRYLRGLTDVGDEQNSTIVFPMPIDLIKPFLRIMPRHANPIIRIGRNARVQGSDLT
ncbi:MAG: hypothetical protein WBX26_02745 [Candidatus Cybelea sp.]